MRKFIFGATFLILAPFCLVFLLIGVLILYQYHSNVQNMLASTNTVAFAALPTSQNILSSDITQADGRKEHIREFLADHGSPLAPYAGDIVDAADKYGIDYRLLPAIAMQESGLCKTIPLNSYNCWGFGIYGKTVMYFKNYTDGIYTVSQALATRYKERGLITPQQIMTMYTPSSNGSWAFSVQTYMNKLQ